jgi:hypothetical protein
VDFVVIGTVANVETIAVRGKIRFYRRLERIYGKGRWRKLIGEALVRLMDGRIVKVELHWYEAHGVGRKELKIKRFLD